MLRRNDSHLVMTVYIVSLFLLVEEIQKRNFCLKDGGRTWKTWTSFTEKDVTDVKKIIDENTRVTYRWYEKSLAKLYRQFVQFCISISWQNCVFFEYHVAWFKTSSFDVWSSASRYWKCLIRDKFGIWTTWWVKRHGYTTINCHPSLKIMVFEDEKCTYQKIASMKERCL